MIAVHGLGGNLTETWTHPKTRFFWLNHPTREMLACRVMVFGYEANLTGNGADLDFQDVASQLAEGVHAKRTTATEKERPIIFLAHSLGGLIVKKAGASSTT